MNILACCSCLLFLPACLRLGPGSIAHDRFDYNLAVSNSWRDQTLLNMVKLRYCESPTFLEVSQIVSGYTWESKVSLTGNAIENGNGSLSAGGSGTYTDRPTITYLPLTGAEFSRNILTPIKPESLLFMLQSGYPARALFQICVQSANGVQNDSAGVTHQRRMDPRFGRLLDLLDALQAHGGVGIQLARKPAAEEKGRETGLVLLLSGLNGQDGETQAQAAELRQILGLDASVNEVSVEFGASFEDGQHLALQTRSMMQILREFSAGIAVPARDAAEGRTLPTLPDEGAGPNSLGLHVHSGAQKPADAAVAVHYRDTWFWIDDRDTRSKLVFSFALVLLSLAETGSGSAVPVLTIPT